MSIGILRWGWNYYESVNLWEYFYECDIELWVLFCLSLHMFEGNNYGVYFVYVQCNAWIIVSVLSV